MKFLVIGLGSMGKRRVRNLQYLKAGEIVGFDPKGDRRKEAEEKYGIRTFEKFDEAMKENPDAFIISTPPDRHMEYAMIAAKNNKHFFTEASVVDDGMVKLIALLKGKKIIAAPSATMRFHTAVLKIRELIKAGVIGKLWAFTYHMGQYLPDWHPWEDYTKFYVAKRETGAAREMVAFELSWITWMLGDISKITCLKDKVSDIDVDIDDIYQIVLELNSGALGHIMIDVISRYPIRVFRLLGEKGIIEWDSRKKTIDVFTVKDKKTKEYKIDEGKPAEGYKWGEKMYRDEMKHFVNSIKGLEKYIYTFEEDKKNLGLLYSAEKSCDKKIHVKID